MLNSPSSYSQKLILFCDTSKFSRTCDSCHELLVLVVSVVFYELNKWLQAAITLHQGPGLLLL